MTFLIPHPEKPAWGGPMAGITQSLLSRFMQCPFRFYLYAYCGLDDPKDAHENLVWGDTLHKGLEHVLRGDPYELAVEEMHKYFNEEYPSSNSGYKYTTANMLKLYPAHEVITKWGQLDTEVKLEEKYTIVTKHGTHDVLFRGKTDMVNKSRTFFGDHKCKGRLHILETQDDLVHDLQMNLYAYLMQIENWQYDLIQIPEEAYRCPERRKGEEIKHWADRIFETANDAVNGFPINRYPFRWIYRLPHHQPMEKINRYMKRTIEPLVLLLIETWNYLCTDFDPNNESTYNHLIYEKPVRLFDPMRTDKFKGDMHDILIGKMDYDQLVPVKSFYPELPVS